MVHQQTAGRAASDRPSPEYPGWVLPAACLVWAGLWYLTPGLHSAGLGALVSGSDAVIVLVETGIAVLLLAVIISWHRRMNRRLLASSRQRWFYLLPLALAVALPLHYTMPLPLAVYMVWITVSVFWQDYLTFGLLQNYLGDRLPEWATIAVVAFLFFLGHALVLPDQFGPGQYVASAAILVMGVAFALVRARAGTLHPLLALHLAFYFLFA